MFYINKIFIFNLLIVVLNEKVNCDTEIGKTLENNKSNKKMLLIKSIPGYPGSRSDVYEIFMDPYYFYIGKKGVAEIRSYNDKEIILNGPEGKLMFQQLPEGMRINGTISGLPYGVYRLHINEKGLLSKQGCKSSGVNYNPYKIDQGQDHSTADPLKDISDLGDIKVENETTEINLMSKYLTLTGANGIIGRTVVIEKTETKSNDNFAVCGIIGIA